MQDFHSVDDILDYAITQEQGAYEFYTHLAATATNPALRDALVAFAQEELGHKARLQAIRQGARLPTDPQAASDLGLADILVADEPSPDMDYQQILILAIKKEQAAFQLYTRLGRLCTDPALARTFADLAGQEARHKQRFEIEYEQVILKED